MINNTAILIFSRSAASEAAHKRLLNSHRKNTALVTAMLSRTRQVAAATGLPVFFSSEADQSEGSFGRRIKAAAQRVIDRGFKHLIILGNDAPQLNVLDLRQARAALESGSTVIGRDAHGGAYLIGLSAEQCNDQFSSLPWQTGELAASLVDFLCATNDTTAQLLRKPKAIVELRVLRDLNGKADLAILFRFLLGASDFKWLFITQLPERFFVNGKSYSLLLPAALPLRGPPAAA